MASNYIACTNLSVVCATRDQELVSEISCGHGGANLPDDTKYAVPYICKTHQGFHEIFIVKLFIAKVNSQSYSLDKLSMTSCSILTDYYHVNFSILY